MKERGEVDKKDFINSLFILNLKYVNKYSEFMADSLSLNWSNFVKGKKESINKILKNIDKISKIEGKKQKNTLDKVIMMDNILLVNKYIKKKNSRYLKNVMYEIQHINSFSELLRCYLDLYNKECTNNEKKDELQEIVNTIKKKSSKKIVVQEEKGIVYSLDDKGYYYTHIVFDNNKMIFDEDSFNEEKKLYYKCLNDGLSDISDKKYKFSSFEKKRRNYVNSMFELDSTLHSLINKNVDITYPIDKVFKCAKEIVDILYKEAVDIQFKKSVLHNLMMKTIENYGSKSKISLYRGLVNKLNEELEHVNKYVYDEFVSTSSILIDDYGYSEFKSIKGLFPGVDDLYIVVNRNIKQYVVKNIKEIISNLEYLDIYTEYMEIYDIVDVYNMIKDSMIGLRVSTRKYVLLQEKVVSLIVSRFGVDSEVVYRDYILEDRMC